MEKRQTRPRDDEAAALRPTLLLALIVCFVVAFVFFWPRKTIEIAAPPKSPDPVAATTTASAPAVAPPIEEITDEVIVIVPAPTIAKTRATGATARIAIAEADAAVIAPPLALSVGPITSVEHVQPRNTQPDKSEPARVTTKIWDCPWPPRGSQSKITQIKVHVKVSVSWEGRPTEVEVLDDPGLEFGEYAKKCALTQVYVPARDAQGSAVNGQTQAFAVLFDRGGR